MRLAEELNQQLVENSKGLTKIDVGVVQNHLLQSVKILKEGHSPATEKVERIVSEALSLVDWIMQDHKYWSDDKPARLLY